MKSFLWAVLAPLCERELQRGLPSSGIQTPQCWVWLQHQELWCTITEFVSIRRIQIVKPWLARSLMRLMRLAHSQTISVIFLHTLLMRQTVRWGRYSEGSRREGETLTLSSSPAYMLAEMGPPRRHTPLAAVQHRSRLLLRGPHGLSLNPSSTGSTSGHARVLARGLPVGGTSEPPRSPHSPRACRLELWLGGRQHSGAI